MSDHTVCHCCVSLLCLCFVTAMSFLCDTAVSLDPVVTLLCHGCQAVTLLLCHFLPRGKLFDSHEMSKDLPSCLHNELNMIWLRFIHSLRTGESREKSFSLWASPISCCQQFLKFSGLKQCVLFSLSIMTDYPNLCPIYLWTFVLSMTFTT